MASSFLRLLLLVLAGYATVTLLVILTADSFIFRPPPPTYTSSALPVVLIPVEGDDSIAILHLPNSEARFTLLFSHGNAEDLGHMGPIFQELRAAGFAVLAYDYRGYGRSEKTRPTVQKAIRDVETLYRYAVEELGIGPERLILHGRSVGSGPTLELALRRPAAGVILEGAFTSTFRVATRVAIFPFDRFTNVSKIGAVERPVLIIHGTEDEVIPFWHGEKLYEAATEPKFSLWIEGAGHNDLTDVDGDAYRKALRDFEELLLAGDAGP